MGHFGVGDNSQDIHQHRWPDAHWDFRTNHYQILDQPRWPMRKNSKSVETAFFVYDKADHMIEECDAAVALMQELNRLDD